jgi:Ca-activated chloride channel family protein
MVVVVGTALLGPHLGAEEATFRQQPPAQVVVALDRTASMAVRDADPGSRWDRAVDDVRDLVEAQPDTSFALVTWGAGARVAVPFTTDTEALEGVAASLDTERPVAGVGSRVDRALETLERLLRDAAAEHPGRERFLVLLSDGEDTTGAERRSFARLAPLLTGGLVVGYGSDAGGPVPLDPERSTGFVPDPGGAGPAVSRRGTGELRAVAEELGVDYRGREQLTSVDDVTALLEPPSRVVATATTPRDVTWVLGLLLLVLVATELRSAGAGVRELRSMRGTR